MAELEQHVVVVWRDESRDPLKTRVEFVGTDGPFLAVRLPSDLMRPDVKSRVVMFPADTIRTVEIEEREARSEGYREPNPFREQPDKSPHFKAMGAQRDWTSLSQRTDGD